MTSTAKVARWFSQLQTYDQSPSLSRPESGFVSSAESRSEKNLKKSEVDENDGHQDDEYADEYLLVEGTTSLWSKLSVKKRKRLLGLKLGKVTTFWRHWMLAYQSEEKRKKTRLKLDTTEREREIRFNRRRRRMANNKIALASMTWQRWKMFEAFPFLSCSVKKSVIWKLPQWNYFEEFFHSFSSLFVSKHLEEMIFPRFRLVLKYCIHKKQATW